MLKKCLPGAINPNLGLSRCYQQGVCQGGWHGFAAARFASPGVPREQEHPPALLSEHPVMLPHRTGAAFIAWL